MSGASKWIERCFWTIGLLTLAVWLAVWFNARWQQAEGSRELDRRMQVPGPKPSRGLRRAPRLPQGDLIGRIEIPRLQISTVVFEGTDDAVLRIGVGHLPGSPLPGERGNVVLAGHRDTFFRSLRNIREHDAIDVVTPNGTRRYRVNSITIVTPDDVGVLAPESGAVLTLITCYPFDWFGHAPKRFIVRARALDVLTREQTPPIRPRVVHPNCERDCSPQAKPIMLRVPLAGKTESSPAAGPAEPSVPEVASVQEAPTVQEESDQVESAGRVVDFKGNRMVRGLKKLNPKRLIAKISAN